jgi:Protein of unknown function (DUF4241)
MPIDIDKCFSHTIRPGNYPVVASIANFSPTGYKNHSSVMVQFQEGTVTRWENAVSAFIRPLEDHETYVYGVDSGKGCFMDRELAQVIKALSTRSTAENEEFLLRLQNEFLKNEGLEDCRPINWANIHPCETSEANIVAFSSGGDDGGYPSYWGYNELGEIISLATDFYLFTYGELLD